MLEFVLLLRPEHGALTSLYLNSPKGKQISLKKLACVTVDRHFLQKWNWLRFKSSWNLGLSSFSKVFFLWNHVFFLVIKLSVFLVKFPPVSEINYTLQQLKIACYMENFSSPLLWSTHSLWTWVTSTHTGPTWYTFQSWKGLAAFQDRKETYRAFFFGPLGDYMLFPSAWRALAKSSYTFDQNLCYESLCSKRQYFFFFLKEMFQKSGSQSQKWSC